MTCVGRVTGVLARIICSSAPGEDGTLRRSFPPLASFDCSSPQFGMAAAADGSVLAIRGSWTEIHKQ